MNIIFLLIPLGLFLLVIAISAFFWAVRNGQFDDLDSPANQILDDAAASTPDNQQRHDNGKG